MRLSILQGIFMCLLIGGQVSCRIRVCYFTNWSQFRPDGASFTAKDVIPSLCTHIVFAFAQVKNNKIVPQEPSDEPTKNNSGNYNAVVSLKKKNPLLKVLLAVGGWEAKSTALSSMAATRKNRTIFVRSTIEFLRKRGFDGLDIDWEYPTRRGGRRQDKTNLPLLLKELTEGFQSESVRRERSRLLLTMAVPSNKRIIDTGYDVPAISSFVDYLFLMTYDFHGQWDGMTGINSPLYSKKKSRYHESLLNINWAANYWIRKGTPIEKIVVGIPLYGRSFKLKNATVNGIGAVTVGPGPNGTYTNEGGMLAYYEICQPLKKGATRVWQADQKAPYMYDNTTWVSFENARSLREKIRWLKKRRFGGVMVWALDLDDFSGKFCGYGRYPLLKAINRELRANPRRAQYRKMRLRMLRRRYRQLRNKKRN